ncbi:MAG: hypothetical protein WCG27_07585 [Pseudomonadota bacterium]
MSNVDQLNIEQCEFYREARRSDKTLVIFTDYVNYNMVSYCSEQSDKLPVFLLDKTELIDTQKMLKLQALKIQAMHGGLTVLFWELKNALSNNKSIDPILESFSPQQVILDYVNNTCNLWGKDNPLNFMVKPKYDYVGCVRSGVFVYERSNPDYCHQREFSDISGIFRIPCINSNMPAGYSL